MSRVVGAGAEAVTGEASGEGDGAGGEPDGGGAGGRLIGVLADSDPGKSCLFMLDVHSQMRGRA